MVTQSDLHRVYEQVCQCTVTHHAGVARVDVKVLLLREVEHGAAKVIHLVAWMEAVRQGVGQPCDASVRLLTRATAPAVPGWRTRTLNPCAQASSHARTLKPRMPARMRGSTAARSERLGRS